jgi:hypothetical protein
MKNKLTISDWIALIVIFAAIVEIIYFRGYLL